MKEYRKRPVVIKAVRLTKNNALPLLRDHPDWVEIPGKAPVIYGIKIRTPSGVVTAKTGDWICMDVEGCYYPCTDSVFRKTYDPVVGDVRQDPNDIFTICTSFSELEIRAAKVPNILLDLRFDNSKSSAIEALRAKGLM